MPKPHVLIAALVLGLVPINAEASIPTAPTPELEWMPPGTMVVNGKNVALINVEGLILYTDFLAVLKELAAITTIAGARVLLRDDPRMLGSALNEFGKIARLSTTAVGARSSQIGNHVSVGIILASFGFF